MQKFNNELERLANTFCARDIMVPKDQLICAKNYSDALKKLGTYNEYDIIPIVNNNEEITNYTFRYSTGKKTINRDDLISENTSIMDVVNLLQHREFYFVLIKNKIGGYIHFSDLNKSIVKLPYFLLLQDIEECIVKKIDCGILN